ncbi:MAG: pyridoxal 5'-phosphate synthase glutaminase subunit PdxT, partial [Solirubrobacterales bacterium]
SSGRPVLATCAGMIILGRDHLGVLDASVRRNAFGRQVRSFEQEVDLGLDGGPVRAAFIRAPWVDEWGPQVEVLAEVDGHPVAVRQGPVLAVAFHPEIAGDERLHRALVEDAATARTRSGLT